MTPIQRKFNFEVPLIPTSSAHAFFALPFPYRLTLRLYLSASTSIVAPSDPSLHLEPPPLTKNFLISPPGSPPEGWEPILEDPPNSNTLAADLMKALEALDFASSRRKVARGEVETVVEGEGNAEGMRVTVQDMTPAPDEGLENDDDEIFESLEGQQRAWAGKISMVKAGVESMGGSVGESGGARTPGGSLFGLDGHDAFTPTGRIAPTPMPPRQ